LLKIDPISIAGSATHVITIEAGDRQSLDPTLSGLDIAKKALKVAQDAKTLSGETAHKAAMLNPTNMDEDALKIAAKNAKELAEAPLEGAITAAEAQVKAAGAYYLANPSLYLSAGTQASLLSAIEAKAPNFKVIADSISLSDEDIPVRGLFVKKLPTPDIELVNTPVTHKISMAADGTTLKFGVSEIQLKPAEIVIQNGTGSISVKATGLTIKVGNAAIELSPLAVNVGKGRLKVIAA
jgi:hypothetical protein